MTTAYTDFRHHGTLGCTTAMALGLVFLLVALQLSCTDFVKMRSECENLFD